MIVAPVTGPAVGPKMPPEIALPVTGFCKPPFGVNKQVKDRIPWPQVELVVDVNSRPLE